MIAQDDPKADAPAAPRTLEGHDDIALEFGPLERYFEIGGGSFDGTKFVYQMTAKRDVDLDLQDSLRRYRMRSYSADRRRMGADKVELLPRSVTRTYEKGESVRLRFPLPKNVADVKRLAFQAFAD